VGKLFSQQESVLQLATDPRAGLRTSLLGHARGRPLSSARPFDEVLAYSSEPMLGNGAGKAVAQRERAENRGQTGPCLQGGRSTWKASKGLLAPWAAFRLIARIYRLGIQPCECRLEFVWPAVPGACRIRAFGRRQFWHLDRRGRGDSPTKSFTWAGGDLGRYIAARANRRTAVAWRLS
jgi:hypothetical protein